MFLTTISGSRSAVQSLIPQNDGTRIGDMTSDGTLAAAFDGNTNQATAATANTPANTASAFVGKTFSVARRLTGFKVWGSNNSGFVGAADPTVTAELYGKNGVAPANATDGTLLAVGTSATDANSLNLVNLAIVNTTSYDHGWVRISHNGADAQMFCAEVEMYQTS